MLYHDPLKSNIICIFKIYFVTYNIRLRPIGPGNRSGCRSGTTWVYTGLVRRTQIRSSDISNLNTKQVKINIT
jgi:hypothetical protein